MRKDRHRLVNHTTAGPMDCDRFIDTYTDYRDGQLDAATRRAVTLHLSECDSCRRYDRVLSAGVDLLRSMDVDSDRALSLGRVERLALDADLEARTALPLVFRRPIAAAGVLAAALLAALAFFPEGIPGTPELELPAVVAVEPLVRPGQGPGIQRVPIGLPYEVVPAGYQGLSRSLLYQYRQPVTPRTAVVPAR
ncbi:MAG: zf-HC2 domain-containing protein [Gemmatimonadetes bacterium]|nr:zf-HC2 domain-containing protein [Gemmatimonadota bacterium]